jgi:hypothetical protein
MSRDKLLDLGPSIDLLLDGLVLEGVDAHAEHLGCLNSDWRWLLNPL